MTRAASRFLSLSALATRRPMDEQTSSLMTAGSAHEEQFNIAVRGYNRPQVQQYLEGQSRQQATEAFVDALKAKGKVEIFI